jgi:hypothetical protein
MIDLNYGGQPLIRCVGPAAIGSVALNEFNAKAELPRR